MDYAALETVSKNFLSELQKAASDNPSSISFIKNIIPSAALVGEGKKFQVMTIGGTNFRSALVEKIRDELVISDVVADTLPQLTTKEILFSFLKQFLKKDVSMLALNFGFPQQPIFENGEIDSILLENTKEHALSGLIGKKVGQEFENYIQQTAKQTISVSVANDTICLLLSGLTKFSYQELAAGIVGTGLNFALFYDRNTPINLEGGNFNQFTPSPDTQEIDKTAANPGKMLFEKEIAGGYLYKRFNLLLQQENISYPPLKSGNQLTVLAEERKDRLGDIARMLLENSAQLVACAVAAIMEFQKKDLAFVMQGSVFWKGYKYRDIVEITVKLLTSYKGTFVEIENADILGAAKLIA